MTKPFESGTKVVFVSATNRHNAQAVGHQGMILEQCVPGRTSKLRSSGPWYRVHTTAATLMYPRSKSGVLHGVPHQVLRRVDDAPQVETPTNSEEIPT